MSDTSQAPKRNGHGHLRDIIYGAIDGSVTTFAIVAGVAGAGLSPLVIIALGFANVIADGFSMAAGNYTGTKAELGSTSATLAKRCRRNEPIVRWVSVNGCTGGSTAVWN